MIFTRNCKFPCYILFPLKNLIFPEKIKFFMKSGFCCEILSFRKIQYCPPVKSDVSCKFPVKSDFFLKIQIFST